MKKKKYDISSLDGLKKVFDDSVQELAEEMYRQIEGLYESAIDMFYADYDPLWYRRTYATYEASSGAGFDYTGNVINMGNHWSAGIQIDPSFISGEPYKRANGKGADKSWVFNRTFNKGIHGISTGKKSFGQSRAKTFSRAIGKERQRFSNYLNKNVPDRGYSVKLKPKYINGKWVVGKDLTIRKNYVGPIEMRERTMENMSPPPKGIMNREFKLLTQKKNMKSIFNNILTMKIQ